MRNKEDKIGFLIMYHCVNCGSEVEELYRRYSPSVLKLLKCETCGILADKYIEYDPVIIIVDLILLQKQAYRHVLYNTDFKSCWKLVIILWLIDSFRSLSLCNSNDKYDPNWFPFQYNPDEHCNLYLILLRTALALAAFVFIVIFCTKVKWYFYPSNNYRCSVIQLVRALVVGACGKLLALMEITWGHTYLTSHHFLILGYSLLCLLTAYSVTTNSGKLESLFILGVGISVYNCASNISFVTFDVFELL